jgi:O-antigen ligase
MSVHERRYSLGALPEWLRRALRDGPAMPAQLVAAASFVAMGASEAGYDGTTWYPVALLTLGLVAVTAAIVERPRVSRWILAGLALFAAYAAWTYASIAWAGVEGDALDAANRTAYYLLVLALFALWAPGPRGARLLLGVVSLGIGVIGLVEILRADASSFPGGFFIDVRFAEPAGYINANVALWTTGMLGCISLAAGRRAHPALRGLCLGSATLLASLALLGQSRGWVFALPLGLIVLLALSPDRVRAALATALTAVAVVVIHRPILDVHDDYSPARFASLLADATALIVLAAALAGLAGAAWAVGERHRAPDRPARRIPRAAALALVGLAIAVGAGAVWSSDAVDRVQQAWGEFKEGGGAKAGDSRFSSGGSNRWDFWGVAWDAFREQPLNGLGADNFQRYYLRVGDSTEKPRYAHSLEMDSLAMLGAVGLVLLAAALLSLLVAASLTLRRERERAVVAAGLLALFAYWLAHASVDWFWAFPGLTAPALASLAMAAGMRHRPTHQPARARRPRRTATFVAAVMVAALAVAFAGPWLSERQVERAASSWHEDPKGAFDSLDSAAALNPLSDTPDVVAATIALRLGRAVDAERRFREVLAEDPENDYAAFELGLIAAADGRRTEAVRLLRQSLRLNPNDTLVKDVLEEARSGANISPAEVNARIVRDARDTAHRPRGAGR